MSALTILKKEDGYWLSIDGKTKALININSGSPMVIRAIEEAVAETEPSNKQLQMGFSGSRWIFNDIITNGFSSKTLLIIKTWMKEYYRST